MDQFEITWRGTGMKAQMKPNPKHPDGIDVVHARANQKSCTVPLPYPAKEVGCYFIICRTCGLRFVISAVGRPDDPRSLTMACRRQQSGSPTPTTDGDAHAPGG